jgi:SAM-dependent methyltransferase
MCAKPGGARCHRRREEVLTMDPAVPRPDTIQALRWGADAAFAMLAGMQLDLFTALQDGAQTPSQLAAALGVGAGRLRLLLYALVAAGLLKEQNGRFANTPEAQHFLVQGTPTSLGPLHRHLAAQWTFKLQTAASIQTGVPQAHLDFTQASAEALEAFLRRINVSTVAAAQEVGARYDFAAIRTLVDVGGGAGGMAVTLTQAYPQLQATVVDLPTVTPITAKLVAEAGATARVTVHAADVVRAPVPGTYEVAIVRELLQVLSAYEAQQVLQHIGAALTPGGRLFIIGQILDDTQTTPREAVGFNLIFLNTFYTGESYTEGEHRAWLQAAGFVNVVREPLLLRDGFGSGLIIASKQEAPGTARV